MSTAGRLVAMLSAGPRRVRVDVRDRRDIEGQGGATVEEGLHEFLSGFVASNDRLTRLMGQDYQFG